MLVQGYKLQTLLYPETGMATKERGNFYLSFSFKCIEKKMWENSPFLVRQVEKIGAKYAAALVEAGLLILKIKFVLCI